MQNFCVAVRRKSNDLFTERVGWMVLIPTIVVFLVLGIAVTIVGGWSNTTGYPLFGILAIGGAGGFASFVIQTEGRPSLLSPVKSVEYLGLTSFLMLGVASLAFVSRFLAFVFD